MSPVSRPFHTKQLAETAPGESHGPGGATEVPVRKVPVGLSPQKRPQHAPAPLARAASRAAQVRRVRHGVSGALRV